MREIKFRAFPRDIENGEEKRMVSSDDFCLGEDFQPLKDSFMDTQEHWHLMQFTGWKDKNGKEIYEGDIVRFDNTKIGGVKGTAEICWLDDFTISDNPGWCMFNNGWLNRDSFLGCEIIGNIYDNNELLNNKP